jgi:hypothetical protein
LTSPEIPPSVQAYVVQLHALVDQLLAPLHRDHAERLMCRRGCSDCCVDNLTVFEVEADRIRGRLAALAEDGADLTPGPSGACALLDPSGACRVYAERPYVCRSQGLPLRWGDDTPDGPVEHRDICPLNDTDEPLDALPAEACWTLGPVEARLASAQQAAQQARGEAEDAPLRRVALRDLLPVPAL